MSQKYDISAVGSQAEFTESNENEAPWLTIPSEGCGEGPALQDLISKGFLSLETGREISVLFCACAELPTEESWSRTWARRQHRNEPNSRAVSLCNLLCTSA